MTVIIQWQIFVKYLKPSLKICDQFIAECTNRAKMIRTLLVAALCNIRVVEHHRNQKSCIKAVLKFFFFLSKWFTRFTNKTTLQNKLWNNKNKNREKAFNKTMTKHIQNLNNIFWMLRQWLKSRIKWHKKHGSKKSTGPKERTKLH